MLQGRDRQFQSTPPARGATAGGGAALAGRSYFNPRPPRGGRRRPCLPKAHNRYFNPRPPRGGRLGYSPTLIVIVSISIHAPREGGDGRGRQAVRLRNDFNPRPPRGGRLLISRTVIQTIAFQSTPPARGATKPPRPGPHLLPFQSTPPRGGRRRGSSVSYLPIGFQSTPPARGATKSKDHQDNRYKISIHAPREGGDWAAPGGPLRTA